jgi:hypothetical protein
MNIGTGPVLRGIEIVGRYEFGNFIVLDGNQAYWRICPEDLTCEIVTGNSKDYLQLVEDVDFR